MTRYVIDSNSFISAARNFYRFKIFPSFWDWFIAQFTKKNNPLILPRCVYNELTDRNHGTDHLAKVVMNKLESLVYDETVSSEIINNYTKVINYITSCGYYKQQSFDNWMQPWKADPFLIAIAMQGSKRNPIKIVTFELPNRNLNIKNPQKHEPKIPDVAKHFGVSCVDLYDLEKALKLKI